MRRLDGGWWLVVCGVVVFVVASTPLARAADPEKGKLVFEQCAACHSLGDPGDYDGPMLKGVIGRRAGSLEDYRYSAAMKRSDVTWDATTLDKYVADPQAFIPGNRMAFAGISDKAERDNLIAFLGAAAR
jgi:cytochrome c